MSEIIERVARALHGDLWAGFDAHCQVNELKPKDEMRKSLTIRASLLQARAAIEAMRKPTSKMCQAASKAMSPGKRPTQNRVSCKAKHGIRYRAMIDEALKEGAE